MTGHCEDKEIEEHPPVIKILKDEEILAASLQSRVGEGEFYFPLHHGWSQTYYRMLGRFVQFNLRPICKQCLVLRGTDNEYCQPLLLMGDRCPFHHSDWLIVCIVNLGGKNTLICKYERVTFSRCDIHILCENTQAQ